MNKRREAFTRALRALAQAVENGNARLREEERAREGEKREERREKREERRSERNEGTHEQSA